MRRERARNSLGRAFVAQVPSHLFIPVRTWDPPVVQRLSSIPADNSAHPHTFYLTFLSFLTLLVSVRVGLCLEEAVIHLLTAVNSYVECGGGEKPQDENS